MQAVISGRAGVALLIDGENWTSLHADDPTEAIARHAGDFPFLFGDARDLQFLESVDRKSVTEELELACDRESSLYLALFVLDADLPSDVREEAACELDTLLKKDRIADYLESILYAQPLPESADVTGATQACCGSSCELVAQLFQRLIDLQTSVREVRLARNHVPIQHFGTVEDRRRAEATFVREGLFRRLVVIVSAGETVDQFVAACLENPRVLGVHTSRRIVAEWVSPFREPTAGASGRPEHATEEADAPMGASKPQRQRVDQGRVRKNVESKQIATVESRLKLRKLARESPRSHSALLASLKQPARQVAMMIEAHADPDLIFRCLLAAARILDSQLCDGMARNLTPEEHRLAAVMFQHSLREIRVSLETLGLN